MKNKLMELVEKTSLKTDAPKFRVGDTVEVHQKILEGEKTRVQVFAGTVIAIRGEGTRKMFTVRKIVQGEGVERIFPVHSPKIAKVEVKRTGEVRRAKLYYLRKRVGKATRLRERKVHSDTTPKKKKKPGTPEAPAPATTPATTPTATAAAPTTTTPPAAT